MTQEQRIQVREKLRQKTQLAVTQALGNGEAARLKATLDELEDYSKLLAITEGTWTRDSGLAVAVAIICLAVAGVLWSAKVRHTHVSLVTDTDSLHGDLSRDWRLEDPLAAPVMHSERLSAAHAPGLGLSVEDPGGDNWFRLDGGQVVLEYLQVDKNASIEARADKDELMLLIRGAPFRGQVSVTGKGTLTAGTNADSKSVDKPYDLPVPETIEFVVQERKNTATLSFHSPQAWTLGTVPFSNLSFAFETEPSPAVKEITSGIKSGTLQFNDTSWPVIQLFGHELIFVPQSIAARIQVQSANDAIRVTLNGLVSNITLGDADQRRELAPSYLEVLYNKKSLALFWGAVVFAWGLLWGVRKTVFR
jgi:hypothetical protein